MQLCMETRLIVQKKNNFGLKEKSAFVAIADDGEGYDYNYVIKK